MDELTEIGSQAVWGRTPKQLSQGPVANRRTWPVVWKEKE